MNRSEAQSIVDAVTFTVPNEAPINSTAWLDKYPPYRAVSADDARQLLGDESYERLLKDRIRNHGPKPGTHYHWNVVDYLAEQP